MITVLEKVKQSILDSSSNVTSMVESFYVQKEQSRRRDIIIKAVEKHDELQKSLKKLKPDQELFDDTGKVVQQAFSKKTIDEKLKISSDVKELALLIDKVLYSPAPYDSSSDYQRLEKLSS